MTRTDERSAEAKARKQARKDALGRSGRILSTPLKPGERMKHNYSDDDLRVGRAAQQKGTRFSKSLAQRQAADTRPNKKYGYTKVRDKGINSSTELVRGARLALAEAILREMKVLGMTPLADRLPKNKRGRGYAQLDTIDQMKVRHNKGMKNIQAGKRKTK